MRLPGTHLAPFLIALACHGGPNSGGKPTVTGTPETGLKGTAQLIPTRPFCPPEDPCRAPLQTSFEVRQGQRVVAQFVSDSEGRFVVLLPPGTYTVGPGPSVAILLRRQVREVTVGPKGLTEVQWDFDTGIH